MPRPHAYGHTITLIIKAQGLAHIYISFLHSNVPAVNQVYARSWERGITPEVALEGQRQVYANKGPVINYGEDGGGGGPTKWENRTRNRLRPPPSRQGTTVHAPPPFKGYKPVRLPSV